MKDYYYTDLLRNYLRFMIDVREIDDYDGMSEDALLSLAGPKKMDVHFLKRLNNPRMTRSIGMVLNNWPSSLLDIGSGKGYMVWALLEAMSDLQITVCELLPERANRIRTVCECSRLTNVTVESCNGESLPFKENTYEMVTLFEVLEHTKHPERMLSEAARVASKSIAFSMPCKPDNNKEHIHFFDRERIKQLCSFCGIQPVIDKDSSTWYVFANLHK